MARFFYYLYQPYKWLIYIPFLGISTIFFGLLTVLVTILLGPKIGNYCGVLWARSNALFIPMLVKVEGRQHIDKKQSYVIVSNHQSGVDIFILYGWLGIDFKWIMKKELRKVPALGIACAKIGHIFIDRSSPKQAFQSLKDAERTLVNGTSVVVFPEGTRSGKNEMNNFKRGAFKIAFDLQLPILPVTIVDSCAVYHGGLDIEPGKAKLIFHKPIDTKLYLDKEDELIALTKSVIGSGLKNAKS